MSRSENKENKRVREDTEEDSGSGKLGMGIVAAGLIVIMSVGATSAGYYGEQKLNVKTVTI